MASEALKLAEEAKGKAAIKMREAEEVRAEHLGLARDAERIKKEAREELVRSQNLSAEAIVKSECSWPLLSV